MFINLFFKRQFSHKSVNLSFVITNINNELTDLCGNCLLQNNLTKTLCEIKSPRRAVEFRCRGCPPRVWAHSIKNILPNPAPYTIHPTLHTLHFTPFTPLSATHTLHPTPHTLHPTPYTLHPMITAKSGRVSMSVVWQKSTPSQIRQLVLYYSF